MLSSRIFFVAILIYLVVALSGCVEGANAQTVIAPTPTQTKDQLFKQLDTDVKWHIAKANSCVEAECIYIHAYPLVELMMSLPGNESESFSMDLARITAIRDKADRLRKLPIGSLEYEAGLVNLKRDVEKLYAPPCNFGSCLNQFKWYKEPFQPPVSPGPTPVK